MVATFGVAVALARGLDSTEWARFSVVLATAQALAIGIDIGFATWVTRELTQEPGDSGRRLVTSVVRLILTAAAIVAPAGAILLALLGQTGLAAAWAGLSAYVLLIAACTSIESALRARRRYGPVVRSIVAEKWLLVTFVVVLMLAGGGFALAALVHPFAALARLALSASAAGLRPSWFRTGRDGLSPRSIVIGSAPFILATLALNVVPRLDVSIVASFSLVAAASFAIGDRIVMAASVVPSLIAAALFPLLDAHAADTRRRVVQAAVAIGAGAIVATAIGYALAPTLVPALFGEKYRAAVTTVRIMILAIPFIAVAGVMLTSLYVGRFERVILLFSLPSSLIGTAAVAAGQGHLGVDGAAAGTVARHALIACLSVALFMRSAPPYPRPQ